MYVNWYGRCNGDVVKECVMLFVIYFAIKMYQADAVPDVDADAENLQNILISVSHLSM